MKSRTLVIVLVAAIVSTVAVSVAEPGGTKPAKPPAAVLLAASDLKWTDVAEFPGVKMAVVEGDPKAGKSHFFLKLPAGFNAPLHFHHADHWAGVVSGTLVLAPEGESEKSLGAGSGFGFVGQKKHTTKCAAGADCVLFVDSRGPWDVVPADKK